MVNQFFIYFDDGMPRGTAQQKGERVIMKNGRPVILHYKKDKVESARNQFILKLREHKPKEPAQGPIKLTVMFYFDVKEKRLWGKPKPTKPDNSNFIKEFEDAMTAVGFWKDDAQVWDLHIMKFYAGKASIFVRWEEATQ